MTMQPANLAAQLHHRATGNPPSTLPDSAISNCFPGLEFDFRNVWRRLFIGIVLHEASGFVVSADAQHSALAGQFLLRVGDVRTQMPLTDGSPGDAQTFIEWSNALADVVANRSDDEPVLCTFGDDPDAPQNTQTAELLVRRMFVHSDVAGSSTAAIDEPIAPPGELTQSLCSPWQNDYQECGCFYWAASRPDYVNVEPAAGQSSGSRWLAARTEPKTYDVPNLTHEQLFQGWEALLRFVVGGRDSE